MYLCNEIVQCKLMCLNKIYSNVNVNCKSSSLIFNCKKLWLSSHSSNLTCLLQMWLYLSLLVLLVIIFNSSMRKVRSTRIRKEKHYLSLERHSFEWFISDQIMHLNSQSGTLKEPTRWVFHLAWPLVFFAIFGTISWTESTLEKVWKWCAKRSS